MNKNFFFPVMLVMALVFGMVVVGCDNDPSGGSGGNGGDLDTWSDVTSLSQVDGSWKAPPSYSGTAQGMTFSATTNNYIITFNAAAKTMSASGSGTTTISGGNINNNWPQLKADMEFVYAQQQGITITFNDANHSYTLTYNNFSMAFTDEDIEDLSEVGLQINQNRSKLKMAEAIGIEIIYTKV